MHSHCKEHLAEMWMAAAEEQRAISKEITRKYLAAALKTSGTGTRRAASSAQQVSRVDLDTRRPG